MDNRRTTGKVDTYIADLPEEIQQITATLRMLILEASPKLTEEFNWSMPNYSYNGLVCYLQASKKHVNLGFHKGNELVEHDVNHLLQGTGKTMRHIRIKKMEDIQHDVFTSLIQDAVITNEEK